MIIQEQKVLPGYKNFLIKIPANSRVLTFQNYKLETPDWLLPISFEYSFEQKFYLNLPEIIFDLLYPDRVSSVLDGREINMKGYFKYKNKFYKLTLPNVKNQDYICLSGDFELYQHEAFLKQMVTYFFTSPFHMAAYSDDFICKFKSGGLSEIIVSNMKMTEESIRETFPFRDEYDIKLIHRNLLSRYKWETDEDISRTQQKILTLCALQRFINHWSKMSLNDKKYCFLDEFPIVEVDRSDRYDLL